MPVDQGENGPAVHAAQARIGASARHERAKLDAVHAAAAALRDAVETERRARELRDRAVRAAVNAGVPPGRVAAAAGISPGRVSHLTIAPRA